MTEEEKNSVNEALNQVNKTRRGFLKALLIGSAALAAAVTR